MNVPFFRPSISEAEVSEVVNCLRGGWLTTGPTTKRFESEFAAAVGGQHAVAVNSCTAALHLAVEAMGLGPGHAVLVPTMTFAASAEVIRYQGATPVLVDCDPETGNMDFADAERKLADLAAGRLPTAIGSNLKPVGVVPVHVGGAMLDIDAVKRLADKHGLWIVEDAAHAFPAAWRPRADAPWQRCGQGTAAVTCYSFYANKTITTGEGGMAITDDKDLADRIRMMSLHGLSHDAWGRYTGKGSWDYRIVAPGYKYNLTDLASAVGVHQLARAEDLRIERQSLAGRYFEQLGDVAQITLPQRDPNRLHSWHLFPIRLHLDRLTIDRDAFIDQLRAREVGCSVHWRPLHLHPYYAEQFGWLPEHLPQASAVWRRLITLPLFPGMRDDEHAKVVDSVRDICRQHAR